MSDDPIARSKRPDKAKRAAAHPERPGERCRAEPGKYVPVIARAKCEGKADCVAVCPYDVFEVRRMDDHDFAGLGVFAKLKSIAHGRKTAYTVRADACQACGLCVVACPEHAVKLVPA
jgi:NAD-dependent dihydropyrimidine dehydrogenase PreA subunit